MQSDHEVSSRRRPARSMLRTAAIVILTVIVVAPGTALAVHVFDDVPDDSVHAPGIEWVAENGITAGCGDGSGYCPNDPVTRAQMGTFLHRLSGNAEGVAPSVDAATVGGKTAAELQSGEGGLPDIEIVTAQVTISSGDGFETLAATCPAGGVALGGGYTLLNGPDQGAALAASEWFVVADQPTGAGTGWTVSVRHEDNGGPAADRALRVHVTCATA